PSTEFCLELIHVPFPHQQEHKYVKYFGFCQIKNNFKTKNFNPYIAMTNKNTDNQPDNWSMISRQNLKYLAKQLAQNYFNTSLPKDYTSQVVHEDGAIKKDIFKTTDYIKQYDRNDMISIANIIGIPQLGNINRRS